MSPNQMSAMQILSVGWLGSQVIEGRPNRYRWATETRFETLRKQNHNSYNRKLFGVLSASDSSATKVLSTEQAFD